MPHIERAAQPRTIAAYEYSEQYQIGPWDFAIEDTRRRKAPLPMAETTFVIWTRGMIVGGADTLDEAREEVRMLALGRVGVLLDVAERKAEKAWTLGMKIFGGLEQFKLIAE